jgi:hypothetical protein
MPRPRDRRRDPEPAGIQDAAIVEAKYRLLHRLVKRYAARTETRDPGWPAQGQDGGGS